MSRFVVSSFEKESRIKGNNKNGRVMFEGFVDRKQKKVFRKTPYPSMRRRSKRRGRREDVGGRKRRTIHARNKIGEIVNMKHSKIKPKTRLMTTK